MGEVVDYAPSWVEISITLGILAVGIFVVTMLIKPALIITQRYEKGGDQFDNKNGRISVS